MKLAFKENPDFAMIVESETFVDKLEMWITFKDLTIKGMRFWTRIKIQGNKTNEYYKMFKKL